MLNVIICEDNKAFRLRTYDIINQYLINTNINYKIKTYESYTDSLKKFINNNNDGYSLYIIDIELDNNDSGIDIANDIRRTDFDSIIILETGTDLISQAQKLRLNILDYVHKSINYDKNILELLEKSLEIFNLRKNVKFRLEKQDYNLKYDDILMIETDSIERKCIITTKNKEYQVKKPLIYFEQQVNSKFYKINRACLINTINVEKYDYNKNIIKFTNGKKIKGMIANSNMKGLKEYVGCSN